MSKEIALKNNKDRRVLIMGLGLNQGGVGAAKYFALHGWRVIVTDLKSESELKPSLQTLSNLGQIKFILGQHREKDFINTDLVIASPAVPPDNKYIQIARQHQIPVFCPMAYFFAHKRGLTVGVTGTKGKSTTTNLLYQILKRAGKKVLLAGNIGISVFEILDQTDQDTISVLEVSNLMLEWMQLEKQSPEIAVITNIFPDHLNRHKTMAEYIAVKKSIFQFPANRIVFLNQNNPITQKLLKEAEAKAVGYRVANLDLQIPEVDQFHPLAGTHNQENIAAAAAVAQYLGINQSVIQETVRRYQGLYGRQMYLGQINGVDIINDTCATTPDAVVAALRRFASRKIILLTGGTDKNLDYRPLAQQLYYQPPKAMIVLQGSGSTKLKQLLISPKPTWPIFWEAKNLDVAIKQALDLAQPGDLLLFSPGGSSFELFANEFDRGKKFESFIKNTLK